MIDDMARPRGHYLNPDRLDEYMADKGKSLTDVASAADIPRATLSGLYGQHHAASVVIANQLAVSTGIALGSLFPMASRRWAPAISETAA